MAIVAGSRARLGALVLPTRLTILPSTEKTVRAMPRPRTVTMKGLVAQAPGVMPGEMPAIEPAGTGTLITVTWVLVGVGTAAPAAQGFPATPARASPSTIWVARSLDSMSTARRVT